MSVKNKLSIEKDDFFIDGEKTQIIAGAMHYFRIHPDYWRDRMEKMVACGINTLETYIAWNVHEPKQGEFDFSSPWTDIKKFILLAEELGLYVIVRPGPYICSEWDFGALPAWLLKDPGMRLRCANPSFLKVVDRYLKRVCEEIADLQYEKKGPIIAVQLENEYGSYGNDKTYLRFLLNVLRKSNIEVPIFTSDGSCPWMLNGGTLPEVFKTVNFGANATDHFTKLREYQPDGPLVCMEYWNGWFTHWGEKKKRRDALDAAESLDEILKQGASVSIYMFHGGTNFGFMNGANCIDDNNERIYQPIVTSYDQDAPLSESGELTEKYHAFRDVIGKYKNLPSLQIKETPTKAYGKVNLTEYATLFQSLDILGERHLNATPEPMEYFGQDYGFILYRTTFKNPHEKFKITIQYPHDRALIFINGKFIGTVDRNMKDPAVTTECDEDDLQIDILVENMGRINYGAYLYDQKGITEGCRLNRQFLFGWQIFTLPLKDLQNIKYSPIAGLKKQDTPTFYKGTFNTDTPCDTFLEIPTGEKGVAWINGFNLGRYWDIGPQKRLYVPAPLLQKGSNELILFEQHNLRQKKAVFKAKPDLGCNE